ncbi:Cell wall assembly/cell proliferation coordinating protein, KNR4-like protein [Paenibacillus curdlanolyticus YK9]|uniref:Cell wall assembly/cell proliferation coordinating protein, KNR4-like protein n=1 Tax=Paenibacillus curdlanolyticus YK9 TaxID=717606 RepID=E0IBM2_9BACL|nr:SMI1/KNR4 family protein [Paenibacillus curdlanolyticus]EFM10102.1 Cell wall assembly/cell proliferation coordinating protein, KNR4-like protein [Paenibacillus curdlanolyticus YK9]
MWKDFIRTIKEDAAFAKAATEAELEEVSDRFNLVLPKELKDLLEETNGVSDEYGCHLVWPTSRIIEENLEARSSEDYKDEYMPFDSLLFVADAGNGDLFGYSVLNGAITKDDIYTWNHEDDSRTWVAPSLKQFIEGWIKGEISV